MGDCLTVLHCELCYRLPRCVVLRCRQFAKLSDFLARNYESEQSIGSNTVLMLKSSGMNRSEGRGQASLCPVPPTLGLTFSSYKITHTNREISHTAVTQDHIIIQSN